MVMTKKEKEARIAEEIEMRAAQYNQPQNPREAAIADALTQWVDEAIDYWVPANVQVCKGKAFVLQPPCGWPESSARTRFLDYLKGQGLSMREVPVHDQSNFGGSSSWLNLVIE